MSYKIAKEYSESISDSLNMNIPEFKQDLSNEFDSFQDAANEFVDEAQEQIEGYLDNLSESEGDEVKLKDLILPGSDSKMLTEEDVVPVKETNYEDDGDLTKFMGWLTNQYPSNIPKHDGSSVLGCEKAVSYLDNLSREILRNIKTDVNDVLDVVSLEKINNSILADVLKLKEHVKHLKRKMKESTASDSSDMIKLAGTPNNIVISVTPFTRAICGILINSCVSAGKPFEQVYDYLKSKYEIKPREELEILQTLMDFGQPIFKDRGSMAIPDSIGNKKETENMESELSGVDFVRSYFA